MKLSHRFSTKTATMLISLLGVSIVAPFSAGQSGSASPQSSMGGNSTQYRPSRFSKRAELQYGLVWGVDSLTVKWAESGEMIRFNYRVIDPARAATLNDAKLEPALIDPQAHVSLVIPALEKVGKLRQTSTPVGGRSYWMAFSNKGRLVKRGDHVTIAIGTFKAGGLVVE